MYKVLKYYGICIVTPKMILEKVKNKINNIFMAFIFTCNVLLLAGQNHSQFTELDHSIVEQLNGSNVDLDETDAMIILTSPEYGDIILPTESEQVTQSRSGGNSVTLNYSGTMQSWTVPAQVSELTIEVWGAQGASGQSGRVGGKGARMKGTFSVLPGDQLIYVVGGMGAGQNSGSNGGGGGGTFVTKVDASSPHTISAGPFSGVKVTPLIIAGGGGGTRTSVSANGNPGVVSNRGTSGSGSGTTGGGSSTGTAGYGGSVSSRSWGSGGAGFIGNGSKDNQWGAVSYSFLNGAYGGNGGNCGHHATGGFGGGGDGNGCYGGGGGGGYSGGQGGRVAGGGGSYNIGTSQNNTSGVRSGNGMIVINYTQSNSNTAPAASEQSVIGSEDINQTITLSGTDSEGDALTFLINSNPAHGTLSLAGSIITYVPNSNYNGTDSFTFKVSDGQLSSEPATVNITILPVNDAPTASPISVSGNEDSDQTITLAGSDVDGDVLTYVLIGSGPAHGTASLENNTVSGLVEASNCGGSGWGGNFVGINKAFYNANQSLFVIGSQITFGSYTYFIDAVAIHGNCNSNVALVYIVTDCGQTSNGICDGNEWTYQQNYNFPFVTNGITWSMGSGSGTEVTYTPNANYNGSDSFTFTVSDGALTSSPAAVNISILPVNDPPSIISTHIDEINHGNAYNYEILTHDIDGDIVNVTGNIPSWLTLTNNILSGTPGVNDLGVSEVTLTASDGNGGTSTETFSLAANSGITTIDGETGFRMLSSPISGVGVYSDLLEELWTQGIPGSDDSINGGPNVWTWNDTGWQVIPDLDTTYYHAGTGILVYAFSDANFDGVDGDFPLDLKIDSVQKSHDIDVPASTGGWKLVGNPYGVAMDIPSMTERNKNDHNVRPSIHVYDHHEKKYKAHNGSIGEGILSEGRLAPFRAFWVYSPPQNRFRFKRKDRRKRFGWWSNRTAVDSAGSAVINFNSLELSSSAYMSFNLYGDLERDAADAVRLIPPSRDNHLTSMFYIDDEALAINNLPYDFNADIAVDLDVMMLLGSEQGFETSFEEITATWDLTKLPTGISMMLMDNITHDVINMNELDSYTLTLDSKGGFTSNLNTVSSYPRVGESRFTVFMSSSALSSQDYQKPELHAEKFVLQPAYPNPFNPSTRIRYSIPETGLVLVKIFDLSGREISNLVDRVMPAGYHSLSWNPEYTVAAGIYIIQVISGKEVLHQKITYLK
mgnify:CR=1 FL=1